MRETAPITVLVGRFEDLLARGLRSLIDEDPSLKLVAADVPLGRLPVLLESRRPQVAILNFGSMSSPVEVRELVASYPATHLALLANQATGVECAQLLAFGASACLAKATQARDVLNAIHLAARGMQLTSRERIPATSARLTPREA